MIAAHTEADVIEAVRDARERRRSLEIAGAGTKRAFGRVTQCNDILDVSGLSGIVKYEPSELILTCLPGTPVAEINALLAEKSQRLGFEPADWGPLLGAPANKHTIGGVLSADANGSAAVRYGRVRDSLLGFRAVNGLAEAYKGGGKVVKNVTGFDLPKLMCGAMGTLGVLTEVTLRVHPKPEKSLVLAAHEVSIPEGLSLLRRIWQSPLEATGLMMRESIAFIRLEGTESVLREKVEMTRKLAPQLSERHGDSPFADAAMFQGGTDIWRVQMPQAEAEALLANSMTSTWIADWAGGLLWIGLPGGSDGAVLRTHGNAVLVRASEETRKRADVFPPEEPARAALTKAVKAAFDPLGIFNPGRMWEGV